MREKKFSQNTLTLAILTLITVLTWVIFDIYRSYTKTKVKPDAREQIIPLDPGLDTNTLEKLEKLRDISREEINQVNILPTPTEKNSTTRETNPNQATNSGQASNL